MPLDQSEADPKRRRVFFWFVCSALTGIASREVYNNSPEQITDLTYRVAERMTERWMEDYGTEDE